MRMGFLVLGDDVLVHLLVGVIAPKAELQAYVFGGRLGGGGGGSRSGCARRR
ncbi:hypothetical protein D3C76_1871570 [compost metagenome]